MTHWIGGFYATSTPYMSETAANNNYAAPNGAPEGMVGNTVDNWGRELMKDVARWNADMDLVATHNSGNVLEVTTTRGEQYIAVGACYGIRIAGTALSENSAVYLRVNGISPDRLITLGNGGGESVKGRDLPVGTKIIVAFNGGFCIVNSNAVNPEWQSAYTDGGYPTATGVYSQFTIGPIQCVVYSGYILDSEPGKLINVHAGYTAENQACALVNWIHSGSYWLSPNVYTTTRYFLHKNLMVLNPYQARFCSLTLGYN